MLKTKDGIENFILNKIEKAHTFDEINVMLKKAGFSKEAIDKSFKSVKKTHKTLHQDVAASNKFLPLLRKKSKKNEKIFIGGSVKHIGLFAGRVRRKDFTVAMLFLFSLMFSVVIILASFINAMLPDSWNIISRVIENDPNGVIFLYFPIVLAPFLLIFLSLVTRRLHDLGVPGVTSFFYLCVFIYPFSEFAPKGILTFDFVLFILFVFLLSKSGVPEVNVYGESPVSHGSTFTKILNLK